MKPPKLCLTRIYTPLGPKPCMGEKNHKGSCSLGKVGLERVRQEWAGATSRPHR